MSSNGLPLVSICTLVYNHEPYLRECFDGILMQKTNFTFEVLVHDDASIDNSAAIIREYTAKYPNVFKPIYQTENQYSRRVKVSVTYLYPRAKGKYIAFCEGDDYWTDPLKLQKQVDFLESHPDYVMCSHRFKVFKQDENLVEADWYGDIPEGVHYDLNSLIHGNWYTQPLTLVYRLDALNMNEYMKYPNAKDTTLCFYLLKKGKGYMMSDVMGVYRIHSGGIWSKTSVQNKVSAEFKNRIGIYEIEQSYEAAFFVRRLFMHWIPRSWLLQNRKLLMKSLRIVSKHFGFSSTVKMISWRFFLNKSIEY